MSLTLFHAIQNAQSRLSLCDDMKQVFLRAFFGEELA